MPQANFKMGGFRNSEAGRLNCYIINDLPVTVHTSPAGRGLNQEHVSEQTE
ncbi:MAG: hypothetical protein HFH13_00645 [Dorea sp.]|nr:hypothetical protein [Dorea sp.]